MAQICNPLVTRIGDKLIQFLEVTAVPDKDAIEIVMAFHTTIRAVLMGRVTGSGGKHGDALMQALEDACLRYFEHYPENRSGSGDTDTHPSLTTRPPG